MLNQTANEESNNHNDKGSPGMPVRGEVFSGMDEAPGQKDICSINPHPNHDQWNIAEEIYK